MRVPRAFAIVGCAVVLLVGGAVAPSAGVTCGSSANHRASDRASHPAGRTEAAGRIVFERAVRSGPTLIFTAAPDGSDLQRLARGTAPRWSPGGGRIAYTHEHEVWLMRGDGTHQHRLLAHANTPSWAPHGRRLLVNRTEADSGHRKFGILNLRTRTVRWFPLGEMNWAIGSDWSWRDGRIVFAGYVSADALGDTYTVAADFTGLNQVTHTPLRDEVGQRWAPAGPTQLAYGVQDFTVSDDRPCHIRVLVLDLAQNARTRLRCDAERPGWSPSAARLLLARHIPDSPDYDLIKVHLRSGQETLVVRHTDRYMAARAPDWRPPH